MIHPRKQPFRLNNRGAALLSTFLVIMLLTLLGVAAFTLALGSLQQSSTVDNFERDYYAADRAAQQAIEHLKRETLNYYNSMATARANTENLSDYNALYNDFFNGVYTKAAASWQEPELMTTSDNGPVTTETVYLPPVKEGDEAYRYTVESTATGPKASRTVSASITINRNGVTYIPGTLPPPVGPEVLIAGNALNISGGDVPVSGTVMVGSYINPRSVPANNPYYTGYDGFNYSYRQTHGWVDPQTVMRIGWKLYYNSLYTPKKNVTPSIPPVDNGKQINNSDFSAAPYNWNTPNPVYIEGKPGASFTVNISANSGQIFCDGNLTITSYGSFQATADNPMVLYSTGNMTITGKTMENVIIYCGGNLTITGGSTDKNSRLEIYCKGDVTTSNITIYNARIYCGDEFSMTSSGGLDTTKYGLNSPSIVYAENKITLGSTTAKALLYTNGDVVALGGAHVYGQLIAKDTVYIQGSFSLTRDDTIVSNALNSMKGTDFYGSSSEPQTILPTADAIFSNETGTKVQ